MGRWVGDAHVHDMPAALDVLPHGGEVWECACGARFLLNGSGYWTPEDKKNPFLILTEGETSD